MTTSEFIQRTYVQAEREEHSDLSYKMISAIMFVGAVIVGCLWMGGLM